MKELMDEYGSTVVSAVGAFIIIGIVMALFIGGGAAQLFMNIIDLAV